MASPVCIEALSPAKSLPIFRNPSLLYHEPSLHQFSSQKVIELSYLRAREIGRTYNLSVEDIQEPSPKLWEMHSDPIMALDGAATTLLTIHYNLACGTILRLAADREDLVPLIEDLLAFRMIGQFCLTELGHGLDIWNIETEATALPDGGFRLRTPTPSAAKFMPPTAPIRNLPCVAVVWAKLRVAGEVRGIRPFIVHLNNGSSMCKGVKCRILPHRKGTTPINHSLTYFDDVLLPSTALLGSTEESPIPHIQLLDSLWRIPTGSVALGCTAIGGLIHSTSVSYLYSKRRLVLGQGDQPKPIFQFRTQQIPIMTGVAQCYVLLAFRRKVIQVFSDDSIDPRVRHTIAASFKAVVCILSQSTMLSVSERCGAQGLQDYNKMCTQFNEIRGISIAEGDVLVVSLKVVMELLLEKFNIPSPRDPTSFLARYELGLIAETKETLKGAGHHRGDVANRFITPRCLPILLAIGIRLAYEAAIDDDVQDSLIRLFQANAMSMNLAWYCEMLGVKRHTVERMQDLALETLIPSAESLIEDLGAMPYITAPIASDALWSSFVDKLPFVGGREIGMSRARL